MKQNLLNSFEKIKTLFEKQIKIFIPIVRESEKFLHFLLNNNIHSACFVNVTAEFMGYQVFR